MQECRRHRDGRPVVLAVGAEGERQAQRHEDHADILDRRIGQHALEIAVEHGIEQAQHGRHAPSMIGGSAHHQAGGPSRSKAMRTKP